MEEIAYVTLAILTILAVALFRRTSSLQSTINQLRENERHHSAILQGLVRRVHALETAAFKPPVAAQPQTAIPEPVTPLAQSEPAIEVPPPLPEPEPIPVAAVPPASTADWEAMVGGNLLNKLGALILVVGVALFLGYSLTMLGPGGKVAIGLAIGASMLAGGLILERREGYASFGRGLIGGGWAAIYFTVFAAHAIEPARIIENPATATILLSSVSALTILHSLRYQHEAVTALAYVIGFVSLAVSPLTRFSLFAALLLAISLIIVAWRASWYNLGLAGIVLTYVTFLGRYERAMYSQPGLLNAQSLLWIYWIAFELFDILHRRRGASPVWLCALTFWTNAFFFLLGTALHGDNIGLQDWSRIFATIAAAFAVSAALRYCVQRPSPAFFNELLRGGFGSAITVSATFACAAVVEKTGGSTGTLALLAIAQALVVLGMSLQVPFLRTLGGVFHVVPFIHWLDAELESRTKITFAGLTVHKFTITALILIATYVVNRIWTRSGWLYGAAAMTLAGIIIHEEVQHDWGTVAWAVLACAVTLAGWYRNQRELRVQGYLLIAATFFRALGVNLETNVSSIRIATVGMTVALFYAAWFVLRNREAGDLDRYGRGAISIAGSMLLFLLLAAEVQGRHLTVVWGLQGAILLAAGFLIRDRLARISGLLLFLFCIGKLFFYDMRELDTLSRILSFIVLGLLLLAASWVYTRYRDQLRRLL